LVGYLAPLASLASILCVMRDTTQPLANSAKQNHRMFQSFGDLAIAKVMHAHVTAYTPVIILN
jgi:hypothetical protein